MRSLGALLFLALCGCGDANDTPDMNVVHVDCDLAAGMQIVGGTCIPKPILCAASECLDADGGTCGPCATTGCKTPKPGTLCVTGDLYDFATNTKLATGARTVRVSLYEPLTLLQMGIANAPALADITDDSGTFVFQDLSTPSSGNLAIVVRDPAAATPELEPADSLTAVTSGLIHHVDQFVVPKSLVDGWSTQAGASYDSTGGYVAFYYDQPVPSITEQLIAVDTRPVAGVVLTDSGLAVAGAKFFAPDRATLSPTLVATGALGGTIGVPSSTATVLSGSGGTCAAPPCKWENHLGAVIPHGLVLQRFHNCALSPSAASCQ
jgi:hypothetical protein